MFLLLATQRGSIFRTEVRLTVILDEILVFFVWLLFKFSFGVSVRFFLFWFLFFFFRRLVVVERVIYQVIECTNLITYFGTRLSCSRGKGFSKVFSTFRWNRSQAVLFIQRFGQLLQLREEQGRPDGISFVHFHLRHRRLQSFISRFAQQNLVRRLRHVIPSFEAIAIKMRSC